MRQRGLVALVTSVLLAGSATACSPEVADDVDDDAAWRTSSDPVDPSGFIWAVGSTVHLADGATIDTGAPARAVLVGGGGVFFVPLDGEEDGGRFVGADLFFAAPDSAAVDTGLDVDDEGVAVSPDGAHLAVLATDYDTGGAEMRLYDLVSGEGVTTDDGFDTDRTDPVHDLNESEVAVLGITDDEVYARTTGGDYAYDLDSGEARELGDDDEVPGRGDDPLLSSEGDWRIERRDGLRDVVVPGTGTALVPDVPAPRWTLTRWIDASTAVGVAVDGPGSGDAIGRRNTLTLITCRVPSGACETVPGTEGERVLLPRSMVAGAVLDLRPQDAP